MEHTEYNSTETFLVRGTTTLGEIKDNIDDYDAFLKGFNIYGLYNVKTYIKV